MCHLGMWVILIWSQSRPSWLKENLYLSLKYLKEFRWGAGPEKALTGENLWSEIAISVGGQASGFTSGESPQASIPCLSSRGHIHLNCLTCSWVSYLWGSPPYEIHFSSGNLFYVNLIIRPTKEIIRDSFPINTHSFLRFQFNEWLLFFKK